MPSSKLVKYCRIYQWIEKHDSEFAECIRDLCLEGALSPHKDINGITFLMPDKGSKLRENIIKYTYSNKEGADADMAIKLIESLIVTDLIPDIKTFETIKKNNISIGNRLRFRLHINDIKNNHVLFKNGLKLEPVNTFNTIAKKEYSTSSNKLNLAVWRIVEGEPPIEGDRHEIKRKPKIDGGSDCLCLINPLSKLVDNYRAEFAILVETEYSNSIKSFTTHTNNQYLSVVIKILTYLHDKKKDAYIRIKPLLDIDPIITFYIILEPYKTEGTYLITKEELSDEVLKYILSSTNSYKDASNEYKKFLSQIIDMPNVKIFSNPLDVINSVHMIRNELLNNVLVKELLHHIIEVYMALEKSNCINGINPILPETLFQHYNTNHNKRMWQDEYRFMLGECLKSLKVEPDVKMKINIFNNITNKLKEDIPGNNYSQELVIMNDSNYLLTACLKDRKKILQYFITSSDFLFFTNGLDCIVTNAAPKVTEYINTYGFNNRNNFASKELNSIDMRPSIEISRSFAEHYKRLKEMGVSDEDILKKTVEEY